jgi:hypothetical protein
MTGSRTPRFPLAPSIGAFLSEAERNGKKAE